MKIFITGGTGFFGRNLKEAFNSKHQVFAPSHDELEIMDENAVFQFLKENKFDAVIHCATWNATRNSKKDIAKILANNLRMFFNLANYSGLYGKMIYFGSGEEYSRQHWIPRMKEEYLGIHIPRDDSGFSKYIMSRYTQNINNVLELRLFGVFGKYEDWEIRFISNACCKAVWDMPITIKQNVFFDYLYIDDLVKITEWFLCNTAQEKVYNVSSGKTYDILTLARKILKIANKDLEIKISNSGLGREYSGDNSRLIREIGKFSFRDIDSCISELYSWYFHHKNLISPQLLTTDK